MRRILLAFLCIAALSCTREWTGRTGRVFWGEGWSFSLDGSSPRVVNIPHDWGVEGEFAQEYPGETGKLRWWGDAWYRKSLSVSSSDLEGRVMLEIDGAMSNSTVFVNGTEAGGRPYGYSSWQVDMTPYLKAGGNEVAVHVENLPESSRWYPGGGIYRNIWLRKSPSAAVAQWGVSITTPKVEPDKATVLVSISTEGASDGTPVKVSILSDGQPVGSGEGMVSEGVCTMEISVPEPLMWTPDSPSMYVARTILGTGKGRDEVLTPFGVRTAEFRPEGFFLNGERCFLKGVCVHHDAGALGAVWNEGAWERRLLKLKDMGCNAIRMSHNPPAPELLDMCDRMGFLVVDELTDTWTWPKKENGYAKLFEQWAERDLVDMIRRDRNHPSVIAWSIGNECGEQGDSERWWVPRMLTDICHREDPTRPTTAGNDNLWASTTPYASTIDVYGFNYKPHAYEEFRDAHPGQPFYGSETASCVSTRGYYMLPVSEAKGEGWPEGAPYQVSSYDLYAPAWASKPDYEWGFEDSVPECAGEFVWTGFDYLGEPTPYNLDPSVLTNFHTEEEKAAAIAEFAKWGQRVSMEPLPSRSSYFGIMDLAGFKKDRYWLYQARWRPELPMAHILPHWNWSEGTILPVMVYSSGRVAEVFLNGESLGVRQREEGQYRFRWDDVQWKSGELKVLAYKDMEAYKKGEVMASDSVRTSGEAVSAVTELDYEGQGMIYYNAWLVDKDGFRVPTGDNMVRFEVSGPAELLATDAGDPTSHASFRSDSIRCFSGAASAILRRKGKGRVAVKAVLL